MTKKTIWAEDDTNPTGPLRGIRVLDLTAVLMGPVATQMLGDLGADVVKVETAAGDTVRWNSPWRHEGMGHIFLSTNRNKRGLVLDLKDPGDNAAAVALACQADVVVSNIRPAGMARLGLDYETLRKVNPKLIYCAAVGYGSDGPNAGKPVYDDLMQAASGICGLFAAIDGTPRFVPFNLCDRMVGLYVANAITAALYHRAMTGEGQQVEVPMFETMVQMVLGDHSGGGAFSPPEGPMGYKRLISRTRGPFKTADGFLAAMVYSPKHWADFTKLVGCPEIMDDPRFANQEARIQYADDIGSFLAGHMLTRSNAEWLAALQAIDVPVSEVAAMEDLYSNPHLRGAGFFQEMEHPTEGRLTVPRHPIRYAASPASIRRLAPNLGEHNKDFLIPADK